MAYQRVSLSQLQQRLTERAGNNATFWGEIEKADALNEALAVWHALVGEWVTSVTIAVDGGNFYNTPTQITSIFRVSYNGTPLNMISLFELDMGFPGWKSTTGTPYYWAPDGLNKFAIYPAPSSGALLIDGYAEPFVLVSPDSTVDLGDEELLRIVDYAHWYLCFKEGIKEAVESSKDMMDQFINAAALRNSRLRKSAFYREFMGRQREETERGSRYPVSKLGARTFSGGGGQGA